MHDKSAIVSHGVEDLLTRLRDEGVAAGRQQAESLVEEAQKRADWLIAQAHDESERIKAEARRQAEEFRRAGDEALRVAARDTVLSLKGALAGQFSDQVERLVSSELRDPELLQRLILLIAGRVRDGHALDQAEHLDIALPEDIAARMDQGARESIGADPFSKFVLALSGDMLRAGISFEGDATLDSGLRLRLRDAGIEIDLSDATVSRLLLAHLQPRFRALLEGMVRSGS